MDLINEQNSRDNFCFALFSPLRYFFIDLLSYFLSDLSCSTREQSQKTLWPWVDDINLMKSNSMNDFLSLFNLSFRTVDKSGLGSHSIVVRCSCKTSASFGYFSWCFIDGDDVSSNDFFFLNSLNHLLTKIIHSFHLSCFKSDLSSFGAGSWMVKVVLDDF